MNKLAAFRGHALPEKFITLGTLRLFLRPYLGQNATRIFLRQVSHLKLELSCPKWLLHTSIFPKLSMLKCEVSCLKTRRILSFFKVAIIIKKFTHVSSAPVCTLISCSNCIENKVSILLSQVCMLEASKKSEELP